jgi:hypothetical protein
MEIMLKVSNIIIIIIIRKEKESFVGKYVRIKNGTYLGNSLGRISSQTGSGTGSSNR